MMPLQIHTIELEMRRVSMVKTESIVPYYAQVKEDLLDRIHRGELPAGSRIPSEKELTQYYGVSTITVRRATLELVEEKVLERAHAVYEAR